MLKKKSSVKEFQADVGEHQVGSSRDMGVPENINVTKCSLEKHLRDKWHCEVLNITIPFWKKKRHLQVANPVWWYTIKL